MDESVDHVDDASRLPSPTRRVVLTPHSLEHVRPLESGESVEIANESSGPATVRIVVGRIGSREERERR